MRLNVDPYHTFNIEKDSHAKIFFCNHKKHRPQANMNFVLRRVLEADPYTFVTSLPTSVHKCDANPAGIPEISLAEWKAYMMGEGLRQVYPSYGLRDKPTDELIAKLTPFFDAFANTGPRDDDEEEKKGLQDVSSSLNLPDDMTTIKVPPFLSDREIASVASTNKAIYAISKKEINGRCRVKTNMGAQCTRVWTNNKDIIQDGGCVRYCQSRFNPWCVTLLQALALLIAGQVKEDSIQVIMKKLKKDASTVIRGPMEHMRGNVQDAQSAPYRMELFLTTPESRKTDECRIQYPTTNEDQYYVSAVYDLPRKEWLMRDTMYYPRSGYRLDRSRISKYVVRVSTQELANFITTMYLGFGNSGQPVDPHAFRLAIHITPWGHDDRSTNYRQSFTRGFLQNLFTYLAAKDNDMYYSYIFDSDMGCNVLSLVIPLLHKGQTSRVAIMGDDWYTYREVPTEKSVVEASGDLD